MKMGYGWVRLILIVEVPSPVFQSQPFDKMGNGMA